MEKLIAETKSEVTLSADILDYYARMAEIFLEPQSIPDVPSAEIETFPLGIILGVEPWSLPYYQVTRVAAPQLMAG
jgi:succinate-semialdehyde dehydrogenase/glutarate-semialdehyde dehydrogenase